MARRGWPHHQNGRPTLGRAGARAPHPWRGELTSRTPARRHADGAARLRRRCTGCRTASDPAVLLVNPLATSLRRRWGRAHLLQAALAGRRRGGGGCALRGGAGPAPCRPARVLLLIGSGAVSSSSVSYGSSGCRGCACACAERTPAERPADGKDREGGMGHERTSYGFSRWFGFGPNPIPASRSQPRQTPTLPYASQLPGERRAAFTSEATDGGAGLAQSPHGTRRHAAPFFQRTIAAAITLWQFCSVQKSVPLHSAIRSPERAAATITVIDDRNADHPAGIAHPARRRNPVALGVRIAARMVVDEHAAAAAMLDQLGETPRAAGRRRGTRCRARPRRHHQAIADVDTDHEGQLLRHAGQPRRDAAIDVGGARQRAPAVRRLDGAAAELERRRQPGRAPGRCRETARGSCGGDRDSTRSDAAERAPDPQTARAPGDPRIPVQDSAISSGVAERRHAEPPQPLARRQLAEARRAARRALRVEDLFREPSGRRSASGPAQQGGVFHR